jgi:hypothetical protein
MVTAQINAISSGKTDTPSSSAEVPNVAVFHLPQFPSTGPELAWLTDTLLGRTTLTLSVTLFKETRHPWLSISHRPPVWSHLELGLELGVQDKVL